MKKHKDKILYGIISVLIITLLFVQNIIYVRVVENAIIFGITVKEKQNDGIWSGIDRTELDKQIAWKDDEVDMILADARKRGHIK